MFLNATKVFEWQVPGGTVSMVMWEAHASTEGARRRVLNTCLWVSFFFFLNLGDFFVGRIVLKMCRVLIRGSVSLGFSCPQQLR